MWLISNEEYGQDDYLPHRRSYCTSSSPDEGNDHRHVSSLKMFWPAQMWQTPSHNITRQHERMLLPLEYEGLDTLGCPVQIGELIKLYSILVATSEILIPIYIGWFQLMHCNLNLCIERQMAAFCTRMGDRCYRLPVSPGWEYFRVYQIGGNGCFHMK